MIYIRATTFRTILRQNDVLVSHIHSTAFKQNLGQIRRRPPRLRRERRSCPRPPQPALTYIYMAGTHTPLKSTKLEEAHTQAQSFALRSFEFASRRVLYKHPAASCSMALHLKPLRSNAHSCFSSCSRASPARGPAGPLFFPLASSSPTSLRRPSSVVQLRRSRNRGNKRKTTIGCVASSSSARSEAPSGSSSASASAVQRRRPWRRRRCA